VTTMSLAEKIVEKYSDELVRVFPLQNLLSAVFASFIFLMVKDGVYLSALESVFQLSLGDVFLNRAGLLKITLGMLSSAVALVVLASHIQEKGAEKISRFIANGLNLVALSEKLNSESRHIHLSPGLGAALANEYSAKLERRTANLARLSSIAEFFFIVAITEVAASLYGVNLIDFLFSIPFFLLWIVLRGWLVFRFVEEILPLEAHLFGLRGMPYELVIDNGCSARASGGRVRIFV
jgi:hypothetical protein